MLLLIIMPLITSSIALFLYDFMRAVMSIFLAVAWFLFIFIYPVLLCTHQDSEMQFFEKTLIFPINSFTYATSVTFLNEL